MIFLEGLKFGFPLKPKQITQCVNKDFQPEYFIHEDLMSELSDPFIFWVAFKLLQMETACFSDPDWTAVNVAAL